MDYKKLSFGLGVFSLSLGAAELFGSKKIAASLDAEGHEGLVKGFGAREMVAGVNLLAEPAVAGNMWNRVLGDVMDIAVIAAAVKNSPRNKLTWGAFAFVAGAMVLDAWVAAGLGKQTGKTLPVHHPLPG